MKSSFLLAVALLLVLGCEKEQNRLLLNAYVKYSVDGTETYIKDGNGLNNNTFYCIITGDTSLEIMASKIYENVGFYIDADSIANGTYTLNSRNRAYFTNPKDYKRYTTTDSYGGNLTIRKDTFQAKTVLNVLRGTFNFSAVDTLTGKTVTISSGELLMERQEE